MILKKSHIVIIILVILMSGAFVLDSIREKRMASERAATRFILETLAKEEFALNPKCPLPAGRPIRYCIIGNGNIKMGRDFQEADFSDADLLIFHGSNAEPFATFLGRGEPYLRDLAKKKEIIITTLAAWALKVSPLKHSFDIYLDNYKTSGDIFNPGGQKFYYLDEFDFQVDPNLSGVIFAIPGKGLLASVKNYGLGHLLESNFSLRGLQNPITFLNQIRFPKPKGFDGTFDNLIAEAKEDYHTKFLPNIIEMDPKGLKIDRFVFQFSPKRRDKYLPLLKVVRLSNNVYLSSVVKTER